MVERLGLVVLLLVDIVQENIIMLQLLALDGHSCELELQTSDASNFVRLVRRCHALVVLSLSNCFFEFGVSLQA
jgi:hypothetical protein